MIRRIALLVTVFTFGVSGALVGSWLYRTQYPVSEKQRILLTPQVKAGDPVLIAREVDRRDNCEINVRGYVEYADGRRDPLRQTFDPGFGPLGYDSYIMEFPTSPNASPGEAYVWSKPGAACNPLEYLLNLWTPGQEKIDRFVVAEETTRVPLPADFKVRKPAATNYRAASEKAGEDSRHLPPSTR